MTPRATRTPQARRDLIEIAVYIGGRNETAAYRFLGAAEAAFAKLAEFPGLGAKVEVADPAFSRLRAWPITGFRNFLVFYTPTSRGIRVLRVLHGARDTTILFGPRQGPDT